MYTAAYKQIKSQKKKMSSISAKEIEEIKLEDFL